MAELRVYYYNGDDILELVRYQKENVKKAVGYEEVAFCCEEKRVGIGKTNRSAGLSYPISSSQYL